MIDPQRTCGSKKSAHSRLLYLRRFRLWGHFAFLDNPNFSPIHPHVLAFYLFLREDRIAMRLCTLAVCLLFAGVCSAREHDYQKGTLLRMDSSSCGTQEKGSKTVAGEIFGTDGQHKQTQEMLCQEYILQSDHVIYRIRPKDEKHPVLLPIGETAQFRVSKAKLILRVPESDGKEREYIVVSMIPREKTETPA